MKRLLFGLLIVGITIGLIAGLWRFYQAPVAGPADPVDPVVAAMPPTHRTQPTPGPSAPANLIVGTTPASQPVPNEPVRSPDDHAATQTTGPVTGSAPPGSGIPPVPPDPPTPVTPSEPPAAPPAADDPAQHAEKLPEYPKLRPENAVQPLTPDRTIVGEFVGPEGKRKLVRVGLACEVCLREGPLELFLCKKGTKEHEAIVRIDVDAKLIHLALIAAGARPGTRTQFVDPVTEEPKWKPATGTPIKVLVHYTRAGRTYTHPAQEWVLDRTQTQKSKRDQVLPYGWVFAGSMEIADPDNPSRPPYYAANSGDIISISNFPYSMLEIPVEISKDDANLTYEPRTAMIPPLFSKVWVILEPEIDQPDKK